MTTFTPSRTLRLVAAASSGYRRVFATSRVAPLLSRPNPVRHTGFDLDLTVERVEPEAEDVVGVTLAGPSGADLPSWIPGAHLDLFLTSGRQRQYSLCGDPADRRTYRIAVRRIGDGSREVHGLERGQVVRVRGPRNAFPLVCADSYLFVAGGIGITPILPMVQACRRRGASWRLVYLGRSRASMPFLDSLGEADIRPDDEYGLPDIADILPLASRGAAVYLCGPPALGEGARGMLREINPDASLHTERFSPLPVTGGEPFDVRLARSGATVRVGADESALAAIRRELPGVAYSCQQGFCGTCRVRVLDGEVDHRDRTLTDRERADSMLVCVSRSTSSSLVIDL
ncbi:PDR/VanB family oxidoreductase [Amycolatopsis sp. 195334CR]|uniref:PDR/VanB family oxidoreductase n=1 Tax=Amycolatopsis sp. 195334CR TaxID=2814588 RepID=UPI001A8DB100|nr:PDR/VanB family oxidoreductase [Amycolatopsis sp. 195334CR]MBN6038942.1 oxidoreductase [Amycolatopsis sp. 195334CR]